MIKDIDMDYIGIFSEYIKKGYSIELISSEFEIPIENLLNLKKQINEEIKEENLQRKLLDKINYMNKKYFELYNEDSNVSNFCEQLDSEKEEVENIITKINNLIDELNETDSQKINKTIGKKINVELNKLYKMNLTLEQLERIQGYFNFLDNYYKRNVKNKKFLYLDLKKKFDLKQIDTLSLEVKKATSIDRLNELKELINDLKKNNKNVMFFSSVDLLISRKKQEMELNKKYVLPKSMESIALQLADGSLEIKNANEIIDRESKKAVSLLPKNRFSLTEEQQKNIFYNIIIQNIANDSVRFPIKNPKDTLSRIIELSGCTVNCALNCVLDNLLAMERIDEAKQLLGSIHDKYKLR